VSARYPFKCYRAKDLRNPKFPGATVLDVEDQFTSLAILDLKKPHLHCNPTTVDGSSINNPNDHLVCYKVRSKRLDPRPAIEITNVLGTVQVEAKKAQYLCVPSSKTVLP